MRLWNRKKLLIEDLKSYKNIEKRNVIWRVKKTVNTKKRG